MIRLPVMGARRLAAMLVVLAALFHVQWLAACEFTPASGGAKACCAEGAAEHATHCGDPVERHDCVAPFAKGTAGLKLPERATTTDTDYPYYLFTTPAFQEIVANPGTDSPSWSGARFQPDGRSLYLASSRLRL